MSLPEGWVKFNERWHSVGARKWFGDHYKEVVVDAKSGDLAGAAAAVDQEVALRSQATTDAANAHADALEAKAAVVRETGDVTAEPETVRVVEPVEGTIEPVASIVVPQTPEEIEARLAELQAKEDLASETPAAPAA